jgi:hypothetical protein
MIHHCRYMYENHAEMLHDTLQSFRSKHVPSDPRNDCSHGRVAPIGTMADFTSLRWHITQGLLKWSSPEWRSFSTVPV